MKRLFSEVLKRIERFLAAGNQDLTAEEKAVMNTVLSDFKGSICSGQLDRYTERKHPITYEVFSLEFYHDHLMYLKGHNGGYEVKSLSYKIGTLNFERLKTELEKLGFKVDLTTYHMRGHEPNPLHVFYTVPTQKVGP